MTMDDKKTMAFKLKKLESKFNTTLYPFVHQVGGHTQLMLLDQATLCKPLIQRELLFYLNIPSQLENFVPSYKGVVEVRHVDGYPILYHPIKGPQSFIKAKQFSRKGPQELVNKSSLSVSSSQPQLKVQISSCNDECLLQKDLSRESTSRSTSGSSYSTRPSQRYFLLMENIASHYHLPCILDLKMGTRQHGDDASDEKRHRQMAKCAASTSATLGIRLCGMQVYQADIGAYLWKDKYYGRQLNEEGVRQCLRLFFHNGYTLRTFVIDAVIKKLKELREAVEQQTSFRFYSTSLLIAYEGCLGRRGSRTSPSLDEVSNMSSDVDETTTMDVENYFITRKALLAYTATTSNESSRKRHNSSSGEDEDSSLDSSLELTASHQIPKPSSAFVRHFNPGSDNRLLYKCQREHAYNNRKSSPSVDVRMIDFAHSVLATSSCESFIDQTQVSDKHSGPDKGFLFGLDNLTQLLISVCEEGRKNEEEELEDSDVEDAEDIDSHS